jgi:hypothetical protein
MLSGCFSLWSPKFCYCYCYVVLPGHLSQHAKAATAEGLTFSDPIHKKSARNLNLYNFCHSAKKLTADHPLGANDNCSWWLERSERSELRDDLHSIQGTRLLQRRLIWFVYILGDLGRNVNKRFNPFFTMIPAF